MAEKGHPKRCPICGAKFKKDRGRYGIYRCGSRYNYEKVAVVSAPDECYENMLPNPLKEFIFGSAEQAARSVQESLNRTDGEGVDQ